MWICHGDVNSDIVLASSKAERNCETKYFCGECVDLRGWTDVRWAGARAGDAGEFEPGDTDLDWRGHGINGSTSDTGVWNLGLRYGLILTAPHGPGFMKGQLEYAFDVVPAWVITQKTNTAYGGGVNPFAFKWILSEPKKVKPFFEIEGGTLFTNKKVPENTSQINFTTSGALGMHILGEKHNWSVEVRFLHISNAGMTTPNPGINTVQARIGYGWFRK